MIPGQTLRRPTRPPVPPTPSTTASHRDALHRFEPPLTAASVHPGFGPRLAELSPGARNITPRCTRMQIGGAARVRSRVNRMSVGIAVALDAAEDHDGNCYS